MDVSKDNIFSDFIIQKAISNESYVSLFILNYLFLLKSYSSSAKVGNPF